MEMHGQMAMCMLKVHLLHGPLLSLCPRETCTCIYAYTCIQDTNTNTQAVCVCVCVCVHFPCDSAGKESACNVGDLGSIPGLGRSPGEGKGYPLQYSGLENTMNCILRGVAKSWT